MHILLEEIDAIINKFKGKEKEKLADFYIAQSKKRLVDSRPFDKTKTLLLRNVLKYVEDESKKTAFVEEVMKSKILQVRALVLDLITLNYTMERQHVVQPERWMDNIILDVLDTFNLDDKEERSFFKIFNKQLCDEFSVLFCSYEKFNTAGNQLLLNIIAYREAVGMFTDYDFSQLLKELQQRFNEGKAMPISELKKVYSEYKRHIKGRKK